MIEIEIDRHDMEQMERTLQRLVPNKIKPAMRAAAKRAITAGRMAGSKEIQSVYTAKAGIIRRRTKITAVDAGALLKIRGPFEPVRSYEAKKTGGGIAVAIKRGSSTVVPRSFKMQSGAFVQREGRARLPLRGLYGPSVPQLFGNAEVADAVQKRAMEVYRTRLLHELERLMG